MALRFGDGLVSRFTRPVAWDGDTVTAFERTRVLNPDPCPRSIERMRTRLSIRLPSLANVPFDETWAGMIDATPDIVPYMDEAPGMRGFFIATGFSGHGFGIGPGAGRVMADKVLGREPEHDLERFRLSRFSDGSPIELGPLL